MLRKLLRAKINRAKVTSRNLYYEGSITLPPSVMEAADLSAGEAVLCANLNNGHRFETYLIQGKKEGEVILNGAAARLGEVGDELLLLFFTYIEKEAIDKFKPKIIHLDGSNRPCRR